MSTVLEVEFRGGGKQWFEWKPRYLNFLGVLFDNPPDGFINGDGGTNGTISFLTDAIGALQNSWLRVPIYRRNGSVGPVSVSYSFEDITAVNGVDYVGVDGSFFWDDGDFRVVYIPVSIEDVEANKTFRIRLSDPTGGAVLDPALDEVVVTIELVPGSRGIIGFIDRVQYTKHTTTFVATIYRFNGSVGAVSIDYATEDGSGVAGVDYTAASGTLNWADGDQALKTVNITILSPAADKDFFLRLQDATGGAGILESNNPLEINIFGSTADANAGEFGFDVISAQVGESQNLTVTVKRLNGKTGAVSVNYATADGTAAAGTNYTNTSGTLNWADQDDADQTFVVPILTVGFPAFFTVGLDTPGGGATVQEDRGTQTVTILDSATANPEVPLSDIVVGDMFYTIGETVVDTPMAYKNVNIHPLLWTALDGGVAGWDGGSSNFGGSTDLANDDGDLAASMPLRFQMYEQVEGVAE